MFAQDQKLRDYAKSSNLRAQPSEADLHLPRASMACPTLRKVFKVVWRACGGHHVGSGKWEGFGDVTSGEEKFLSCGIGLLEVEVLHTGFR